MAKKPASVSSNRATSSGGGAPEVGQLVADRLGIDYVDRQILTEAAQSLSVSLEEVVQKDEGVTTLGGRLAQLLRAFLERSAAAGSWDPMAGTTGLEFILGRSYAEAAALPAGNWLDDKTYLRTIKTITLELAQKGPVVIIGRGSQVILRDYPGALHVLVLAPKELRLPRLAEREQLSEEDARRRLQESDRARVAFHRKFFKVEVDDPTLYHLVLNTARFSFEDAAGLVCAAAQLKAPSPS